MNPETVRRWRPVASRAVCACIALLITSRTSEAQRGGRSRYTPPEKVVVGTFGAEVAHKFTTEDGLPSNRVTCIVVADDGRVLAGTDSGVALFENNGWRQVTDYAGPVPALARDGAALLAVTDSGLYRAQSGDVEQLASLPGSGESSIAVQCLAAGSQPLVGASGGLYELDGSSLVPVAGLNELLGDSPSVRQVAVGSDGRIAVAADAGLYLKQAGADWQRLFPQSGARSWAPRDVRGVTFDARDRLWFCEPQGVGVEDASGWTLYTGADGLPYADFTTAASCPDGSVLFGTHDGAIRFDGETWEYRRAPRWLPGNDVLGIAVGEDGREWYATSEGAGCIEHQPMTLAEKAKFFEDEIDKYHRRTPYGYVLDVSLAAPADKSEWSQHDSDNDGLWTAMYGAGECFAYAATKDPRAKERATQAFEALKFLSEVTQGGSNPAPPGFPARSILPTSGPNPNESHYTPERDRENQQRDPLWKVISPRWPTSADGKWYWKCDTSSDELDGHYLMYALYYDLVAQTEEEKQSAREVITRITDHLMDHGYNLVDHDGLPTRWGRFSPEEFNKDLWWAEGRGLNSMCMLSYLKVAEHVTGDQKYRDAYEDLVNNHGYASNSMVPKVQYGSGTGNQSDDEMAFMSFYNLIRYEDDPVRRAYYTFAFYRYWRTEEPELSPLFNYIYAATAEDAFSESPGQVRFRAPGIPQEALAEAADTLVRYPLDRVHWPFKNSHRLDVVPLATGSWGRGRNGHRVNGKVIPIDERSISHWNHSPWRLDEEGHSGQSLTDGAAFLLPYYMGLYRGYIE